MQGDPTELVPCASAGYGQFKYDQFVKWSIRTKYATRCDDVCKRRYTDVIVTQPVGIQGIATV